MDTTLFIVFSAGILSFVSPCVFPLYPVFISYITGMTIDEIRTGDLKRRRKAMLHTLSFLLGFSIIYLVLAYSTTQLANVFLQYDQFIRQIGAILIIIFGFISLGVWSPSVLMKNYKLNLKNNSSGFIGSFIIGVAFSAGWTPCMGPILASVLTLISTNPNQGMLFMTAYIFGFSIPFILLAFFSVQMTWIKKYSKLFMQVGGILMIIIGTLLFFDQFTVFNRLLSPIFGDFQGF